MSPAAAFNDAIDSKSTSGNSLLGFAMRAAERGRLPDGIIRFGIRRLLKARLKEIGGQPQHVRLKAFIEESKKFAVAIETQAANEQHYEVPAGFFTRVLGHRLKYSSCYFEEGITLLDAAEDAALHTTCERAELVDGMDILELGCGWGSLSLWMAEKFPHSRITSISNSASQRAFILARAKERGLVNLFVITADVNGFSTQAKFDRVVSVEMFEHVTNHNELFARIARWLKPSGKLFVHIFCHQSFPYRFEPDGTSNWMGRYFFTGGIMPSDRYLIECQDHLKLAEHWQWNGTHYAKTARAWLKRLDENRAEIWPVLTATYGPGEANKWFHRWRIFFMSCEELWAYRNGTEWLVSHYLFEKP